MPTGSGDAAGVVPLALVVAGSSRSEGDRQKEVDGVRLADVARGRCMFASRGRWGLQRGTSTSRFFPCCLWRSLIWIGESQRRVRKRRRRGGGIG